MSVDFVNQTAMKVGRLTLRKPASTRCLSTAGWPPNSWGEADRPDGWRGANWSGNTRWVGQRLHQPESMATLCEVVASAEQVRAIGSAHSFPPIVSGGVASDPRLELVSLRRMPRSMTLDEGAKMITVDAGTTYSEVCAFLAQHTQLALANTASLPHFSVAGAVATGTHGSSGMGHDGRLLLSGMADSVRAVELVGPSGEVRVVALGDADFDCAVTSLGMLGIVTKVRSPLSSHLTPPQPHPIPYHPVHMILS